MIIFTAVDRDELIDTLVDPGIMLVQMVNLLLSKGANVSAKDKKERQAIHWAAYLGKYCHSPNRHSYIVSLPKINLLHDFKVEKVFCIFFTIKNILLCY